MAAAGIFEVAESGAMSKTDIACDGEPGAVLKTDKTCDKLRRSKALSDEDDVEVFSALACLSLRLPLQEFLEIISPEQC